ncbi:phosphoglycerate dehydrogenase-like oxidoreductase [Sanguibacter keddieii DSM 10542]|uniref:Phosphoglycerate dehydrogenase-like oxidoreductase n=1 Tax=Sanguibacter keddieii (strain ATCC 51767 / DSM 10542 / NCFB 3025 / ST-74) TaxID=446469 RepID=D1BJQ3_SANKS|nr:hydroxyacid dehydrogenase [Sanguibacter keddieii]ACZ20309.1 phosphoglycerate dehydrogenase-like oxidoreductase [Sanguibacter keddieii DSM 10542]
MTRPVAAFAARDAALLDDLFDAQTLARLRAAVDLLPGVVGPGTDLRQVEVLVTAWGAPPLDDDLLRRAPRLRAVVHTGGTVKRLVTEASWARGVRVSSAAAANAQPVAEYTLAMVLLAGKRVLQSAQLFRQERSFGFTLPAPHGNNGLVVGLVGASKIGRLVIELLRPFDMEVLLHDPYVDAEAARALGVTAVPLDALLRRSDVVSLHAPSLPETYRMIGAPELALMRDGTTLINTARGALVHTDALVTEVLSGRLRAVLDVTDPEPLPADHPFYEADGVLLTPHVAGSLGTEVRRLGAAAVDEVERLAAGLPLTHEVHATDLPTTA